ncbi:ATP-binding protein [Leptospira perolatii]|uniref:ATP-binding protein n=1 Tax=Leptospira perolatii TaxID=2023191 RepID=A0A2M9ZM07_9LEPT|nr:ABC transporter ATP-binding protein [Leptospira perolatii]PJZ69718.1 ATP-binding protein [Leptospira perolatii]PJZ73067.1 ATP-binding protein [Leptospira perolatii]
MAIVLNEVWKSFGKPATDVIKGINLSIKDGEFISLLGKSGSGKSTLLYVTSSLDDPSRGSVEIDGKNLSKCKESELHSFRNKHMGFVFQFHYLLPEFTALENVLMPAIKAGSEKNKREEAMQLLKRFDLGDRMDRLPSQLSGGQMQRVSIARALIMNPKYIFADEPTGALDSANAKIVMEILKDINKTEGATIVLVTHDEDFANMTKRKVHLVDGKIASK